MEIATTSAIIDRLQENVFNSLFELSKANIERVDLWFSWMLGVAGVFATFIAIAFGAIAYLTWKHFEQAKKAEKLLEETEKKLKASDQFLSSLAQRDAIQQNKKKVAGRGLLRSEVHERALHHRGFAPSLYKIEGDNRVYTIDELGYKHWIPNPPTLTRMGYSGEDIKVITKEEIDNIPTGEHIPDLSK